MQKQTVHYDTSAMSSSFEFQQHQKQNFQLIEPGINSVSWRDCDWEEEKEGATY